MKIEYHEVPMHVLLDEFQNGWDLGENSKLHKQDYFYDPCKDIVVFKLYIEEKTDANKS